MLSTSELPLMLPMNSRNILSSAAFDSAVLATLEISMMFFEGSL